jgi:hypothetical protein
MRVFFFNLQDSNHRGQSFQLIADSIGTITDRGLPSTASWVHAQTAVSSLRQSAEIFGLNGLAWISTASESVDRGHPRAT